MGCTKAKILSNILVQKILKPLNSKSLPTTNIYLYTLKTRAATRYSLEAHTTTLCICGCGTAGCCVRG